jgi:hypothetical protein
LIAEAQRQISSDGVYFEQSACYQRYTCDFYLHFMLLASRCGVGVPSQVRERVNRLVEFLAAISPGGSMPNIGDADGGWLMPLARRDADDCRVTLALAARVLDRVDPGTDGPPRARLFGDGGYAVLRSSEHQAIVDVGPIGAFGHGHADLLSLQLRIFGEPCLVDPGTFTYTGRAEWRDHFRGTAAHNTVVVDGKDQASPQGPFGWQSRPSVTIRDWQATPAFDLIEGQHDAYPGVTHRRRVIAMRDGQFVVVDELLGQGSHEFALTWQFAPMTVELTSATTAHATTPRGHHLWVIPVSSVALRVDVVAGQTNPMRGWVSPEYGHKVPAPALVYSARADLPSALSPSCIQNANHHVRHCRNSHL